MTALHYETVKPYLKEILDMLMAEELFNPFRLVGGTNLSLRFGHRISEDIQYTHG
ncbi:MULTISPECIES: nucleotidyl transferase AbiEii/AbiGii toxin family protein [Butyricimonas]|uniref:nucleotidyl transferase AbiEii/AbiGii toxin family protein n=1 Tax=Butyricimonas TaxID=574697 RepID=UPI0003A3E071|nr:MULTISPECIES: nucleotidyl transferase AbiEii/AbiGii toxin family protein [Butyricimonas]